MLIKPFPEIEDIHVIAMPFPGDSHLVTANVYAVGKGPITLIDAGPKFPGFLGILVEQLKSAGFDLDDIERIIFTHGHVDHFGLAAAIRQAARHPIKCFIHSEDEWQISSKNFLDGMWSKSAERFMAKMGMPDDEIEKIRERFSFFVTISDPLDNVSTMNDGDEFTGNGYHITVIHTPGHSPGACCLYETRRRVLFSGDHVLKHISPNPIIVIEREHLRDPSYQSLNSYLNSLDRLSGLDVRFVFPGHGEHIEDLPNVISKYKANCRVRANLVWNALRKKSRPVYRLIDDVFVNVPKQHVFLAVSEILAHLEMLTKTGRAEIVDSGPPILYKAI